MFDDIQDWLDDWFDSPFGSHITIVAFLGLFGFLMYYTIYILRPMILTSQQHCEESE